jgi:hypothetical protein
MKMSDEVKRFTRREGEDLYYSCTNSAFERLADLEDAIETIEAAIGNAEFVLPHFTYADGLKYAYMMLTDKEILRHAMSYEFDGFEVDGNRREADE